jgi:beta-N-acetylhexosaminidase
MIWAGFSGTKLHDTTKVDLKKRNLGGVILYAANITSPSQVKQLNDTIKKYSNTPSFIAVDQEGGKVARLSASNGYKSTLTAYSLGTIINREDSTRKTAAMMAGWLKQAGFNIDLAPVADVNVNPNSPAIGKLERSFSKYPDSVYLHTKWFIEEFNKQKILNCLKHFPGHGSAYQDSHFGFTDISNSWSEAELIPYKSLIANGYDGMVMLGHLFNSNLDPLYPASLSKNVVTNLLRTQLGFKSVTITDGMSMQAITSNYGFEDSIELVVNAGVDILLYEYNLRNNTSLVQQIEEIIERKVNQGRIPVSRIEESYNRIIQLKTKYGIISSANYIADKDLPNKYVLYQNYPNPFNSTTVISYKLEVSSYVTLKVYDLLGREVANLVDEYKPAGIYNYQLLTENYQLSSGVYFCQLRAGSFVETRKLVLMK